MRVSVRAIVIHEQRLLLMRRNKFGHEYYTLIGGGIDHGETPEAALYREVAEETTLKIANPRLVIVEDAGPSYGLQYIYLADYVSGNPVLAVDSEEAKDNALGQNLYQPLWLPTTELNTIDLLPIELKQVLLKHLGEGFPEQTIQLTIPS